MSFSDVGKGGPKRPNRSQLSTQPTIPESQESSLSDGLRQLSDGILQYQACTKRGGLLLVVSFKTVFLPISCVYRETLGF